MGTVIDHLIADHHVRVIQAFSDANGVAHAAGEFGVIRQMGVDWARQQIWIEWERDGNREKMVFRLDARRGPRNGGMREFFELGDYSPMPRPAPVPIQQPPRPAEIVVDGLIIDETQYAQAVERVSALAGAGRFDDAKAQILKITGWPCEYGWRIKEMAQHLTAMASDHVTDPNPAVYSWLREWSIFVWHMWGSGATSGGEGAAFLLDIDAGKKVLAELDRRRKQAGLPIDASSA
jgi:hypothetical protein